MARNKGSVRDGVIGTMLIVMAAFTPVQPQEITYVDFDLEPVSQSSVVFTSIYFTTARDFSLTRMTHGRDVYGSVHTPLFASALDRTTLRLPTSNPRLPAGMRDTDRSLYGSNPLHELNSYRLLYTLSDVTGDPQYARASDDALTYFFRNCRSNVTKLYAWGEHRYWNFNTETHDGWYTGTTDPFYFIHEMFKALGGDMFNKAFALAPSQFHEYAVGCWQTGIRNKETGNFSRHAPFMGGTCYGGNDNAEFVRIGGYFFRIWSEAYARSPDPTYLTAIRKMLDYYESQQHPETGAIPIGYGNGLSWIAQNLSMAIDVSANPSALPSDIRQRFATLASKIDHAWLNCGHQVQSGGGFVLTCYVKNLTTYENQLTTRWGSGYGYGCTANYANACYERFLQTGDTRYRSLVLAAANQYLTTNIPTGSEILPQTPADVIVCLLNAYRLTRDTNYLNRARTIADTAIPMFWNDGSKLPRASTACSHFEGNTGGDSLALALMQLAILVEHPSLDRYFEHCDRF